MPGGFREKPPDSYSRLCSRGGRATKRERPQMLQAGQSGTRLTKCRLNCATVEMEPFLLLAILLSSVSVGLLTFVALTTRARFEGDVREMHNQQIRLEKDLIKMHQAANDLRTRFDNAQAAYIGDIERQLVEIYGQLEKKLDDHAAQIGTSIESQYATIQDELQSELKQMVAAEMKEFLAFADTRTKEIIAEALMVAQKKL